MLIIYPAGVLDRVDRLIYSLGLGSTGYDYSVINAEYADIASKETLLNITRRRRQSQEFRCPANGTTGEICPDTTCTQQGLVCIDSRSLSKTAVFVFFLHTHSMYLLLTELYYWDSKSFCYSGSSSSSASIGHSLLSALFAIFVHMQVKDQSKRSGSLVISFVNVDRHLITVRTAMTTK